MSTTAEWLLEIGGLTVGAREGADPHIAERGRALATQLRRAATVHVLTSGCDATGCSPACALADVDGGPAACRLAVRLAEPDAVHAGSPVSPARARMKYRQAVNAAATAVFHCRRHAHPAGECWFSDDGADVCGDVLAIAHRLSG